MFYDFHLLRRQNEGRFAIAWAAATRGIATTTREFGKKRIYDLNIILLCEETMEYLQCVSNDPRKRLSLRMTIFLIRGTVLLFNKQLCIFQDELTTFFTKITAPKPIDSITGHLIPSQRNFETPPTPVIKEKRKRKPVKAVERSIALEEFLRLGQEQEVNIELEQPIDIDDRRRRLQLVEEQPILLMGATDEILGDFGVVPTMPAPVREPEKVPSERGSEKSMLEKIEELLAAEEDQEKLKRPSLKRKKRSISIEESPKVIQVEAMVHRPAGEEKKGTAVEATAIEQIESKMPSEIMEIVVPEVKRSEITEESKLMEQIQIVEKTVEKEYTPAAEKPIPTKKAVTRRIPDEVMEKASQESEEERKKKKQLIDKYLLIKFKKQKRILHLDDYDKIYELKEDFKIDIYNERILDANLRNEVMNKFTKIDLIEPVEMVRREGTSSRQHSDEQYLIPKLSSLSTPLDEKALSTPQLMTDPSKLFASIEPVHSTPFRQDVAIPQKILYDESRVLMEHVVPEEHEKIKEKFAPEFLVEQMLTELEEKPSKVHPAETEIKDAESYTITEPYILTSKLSEEKIIRMKTIIKKVEQWDEAHSDLTFDDLIPIPKNKKKAAETFGDLLALSKDGYVTLIPEENSIMLKNVEKGRLLQ